MVHRDTGKPRGSGFVTFETATEADAALRELNGTELQGRQIKVDNMKPRGERSYNDRGGRGGDGPSGRGTVKR